jgi:predicted nicotinamide N-methyase
MHANQLIDPNVIAQIWSTVGDRVSDHVILGDRTFIIERPADGETLRHCAALRAVIADDDYAPFWTELWPAARMLAKAILGESWTPGLEALELGCGLGLPGIAGLAMGLHVTFSDYDPAALLFADENARRNGFADFQLARMDWRHPPSDLSVPLVFASDLVYELKSVEPLVHLLKRILQSRGMCLLTDQDRVPSHALREALTANGFTYTTQLMRAGEPGGRRVKGTLYRIERRATGAE